LPDIHLQRIVICHARPTAAAEDEEVPIWFVLLDSVTLLWYWNIRLARCGL
jgi:hypothetical protein